MAKRTEQDWRPRLSIDLDEELYNKFKKALPWGTGRHVMTKLVESLVEGIEEHGNSYIGALVSEDTKLKIIPRLEE